jgi:hypothetical protein
VLWLRSLLPILSKGERKKTENQLAAYKTNYKKRV